MNVTATVLTPTTIESLTHLDLGVVLAGGGVQGVLAADADAGTFTVTKSTMSGLSLMVAYPSELNGPSGATLPLLFDGSQFGSVTPLGGSPTSFNPSNPGTSLENVGGAATQVTFRFGASVNPPVGQTLGDYTGQIVLTLSYSGIL